MTKERLQARIKELEALQGCLPTTDEIRDRISENLQERDLLRKMLRLAKLREEYKSK